MHGYFFPLSKTIFPVCMKKIKVLSFLIKSTAKLVSPGKIQSLMADQKPNCGLCYANIHICCFRQYFTFLQTPKAEKCPV